MILISSISIIIEVSSLTLHLSFSFKNGTISKAASLIIQMANLIMINQSYS